MIETEGKITISRTSSNVEGEFISIQIRDKNSTLGIVDVEMSLEDFALALTGVSRMPAQLKVADSLENVGKKIEHKAENVFYGDVWKDAEFEAVIRENSKQFEVDGWKLKPEKYNPRKANRGYYLTSFVRYAERGEKG